VGLILEYRAVVWDPHTADSASQIEHVQRRENTMLALNLICIITTLRLLLTSLAEHRRIAGIKFLAGLLNNNIYLPVLI